jgi:peptidoglycan/xylan/chitin deacetylase (PgdA/CDA1 family)
MALPARAFSGARYGARAALMIVAIALFGLAAASVITGSGGQPPTPHGTQGPARVALTFDDLPSHGPLPQGLSRVDVAASIIDTLRKYKAPPTYGFINAKKVEDRPEDAEVLRLWRAAGFPLGNHAFSHMDLHANTQEAFERDVLANEPALRSLMGDRDWRWFRYPYLREGDTPEKYRGVKAFLTKQGYRVAQVTLDFSDYAYNDPYARCLARNDADGIAWLKQSYVDRAGESLTRGQDAARTIFGRDISHVMLLHIGGFETVMLPHLLDLLQQRGFVLTTLEEAQADAAYATIPERDANWNGTLLQQLRPRPAAPPSADSTSSTQSVFATLGSLCR